MVSSLEIGFNEYNVQYANKLGELNSHSGLIEEIPADDQKFISE